MVFFNLDSVGAEKTDRISQTAETMETCHCPLAGEICRIRPKFNSAQVREICYTNYVFCLINNYGHSQGEKA